MAPKQKPHGHDQRAGLAVPRLTTTHERVAFLAELMARGAWLGNYARRTEVARAWGVSESRVRQLVAMAHALVAFEPAEREQLRAQLSHVCLAILAEARTKRSKVSGLPDYGATLRAVELVAKFVGIGLEPTAKGDGADGVFRVILTDEPGGWPDLAPDKP